MKTKIMPGEQQGFTLVETIVGMVMFLAISLSVLPVFAVYRTATIKNDMRIGAIAISQQIADTVRQQDIASLPNSGTLTTLPTGTADSLTSLSYKGKTYAANITYCQNNTYCDTATRQITIRVFPYGDTTQVPLYQLETVYTRLQ
jgi:prepilin-type N-terminal cleavage/methylation domain-containing protein